MIHIGTSGYSYDDWVGPVYPAGTPKTRFLSLYKDLFDACELNFTYYRLPSARTMEGILKNSQGRVTFTVKASAELTHDRSDPQPAARLFSEGVRPLVDAGRLGCVLVQFPYSFHYGKPQCKFVERLQDLLRGLPCVVEFRGKDWVKEEVFSWLRGRGLGFCCVDEPGLKDLIPPLEVVTASIAYVRLHGRNAEKWWKHEQAAERYDYLYSTEELQEWVPRLKRMQTTAAEVFVFANNHPRGMAVANARKLKELVAGQ
jgi:uncharacterized protein YecE (DUF72 family)